MAWIVRRWALAAPALRSVAPAAWAPEASAVASTSWRFAPVSWLTDHRSVLDGTYGSTAHAAFVAGPSDYVWFSHEDEMGEQVGHDPAPAGLTGHEVQLPAGNVPAADVAALAVAALEAFDGVTAVTDNEDGTVVVHGLSDGDLTTGPTFDDRSGGGTMGVRVAAITSDDAGTGGLATLYLSRMVVPGSGQTRRIRTVRLWVETFNASDRPRVTLWRGNSSLPGARAIDLGQLSADFVGPGWADFHVPPSTTVTYASGAYLYLSVTSQTNLTALRYMGSGSGLRGDWDGTFALTPTDGTMSADETAAAPSTWSGGLGGSVAVIFPAQIVWADTATQVGDASLRRPFGTPPTVNLGQIANRTVLPGSIVHMIAPAPGILGLRWGRRRIALGAHTETGSMRVAAWEGPGSLLDGTFPHNPDSDGLVMVHDYGTETALNPEAWTEGDDPEELVYLTPGAAIAISMHSDGEAGTEIAFQLTGTGMAESMNNREEAYDWYPVDGLGAGAGSELEAYAPSVSSPPRAGDGNATVVVDPALPPASPHVQHVSDIWQGNCPGLGADLILDGMGPAAA